MSDCYLIIWEKLNQEPTFLPVKVVNVTTTDDGPWVEFEYLGGPQHGQRGGAPFHIIVSEKERDIARAASDDIFLKGEQIKQINADRRNTFRTYHQNLAKFERDLSHLEIR